MKILGLLLFTLCSLHAQAATADLDEQLRSLHEDSDIPGFAVAIVDADGVLYEGGFGYADVESKTPYGLQTSQPIGSISKTFIAVALMKAIETGQLSLDTKINDVLPFHVHNPRFPGVDITVAQLATHTSSIVDRESVYEASYADHERPLMGLAEFYQQYLASNGDHFDADNFSTDAPGTRYQYSNIASALTAYIIELATGTAFPAYTRQVIFEPLKMDNTGWFYDEVSHPAKLYENGKPLPVYSFITYPDGGLRTSIGDLGTFLSAMLKGAKGRAGLLSASAFQVMFTPVHGAEALPKDIDPAVVDRAVFWGVRPGGTIGHDGGDPGLSAFMFFNVESGIGRIVLLNASIGENDAMRDQFAEIWKSVKAFADSKAMEPSSIAR